MVAIAFAAVTSLARAESSARARDTETFVVISTSGKKCLRSRASATADLAWRSSEIAAVALASVGRTTHFERSMVGPGVRDAVVDGAVDGEACWFDDGNVEANAKTRFVTMTTSGSVNVDVVDVVGAWAKETGVGDGARGTVGRDASAKGATEALGDGDARLLLDRRACFDGEEGGFSVRELERADVDADRRARALVERELRCFEDDATAFAQSKDARSVAFVSLEGASYVEKRFGHKSEIARWSAEVTQASIARVLSSIREQADVELVVVAVSEGASPSHTARAAERKLLGVDVHGRRTAEAAHDDNDLELLTTFTRKVAQWVAAIIFIGASFAGILALHGMPLIREPFLYTPIPGLKLD